MRTLFELSQQATRRANADAPHIYDLVPHKENGEVVGIVLRHENMVMVDTFAQWLTDEGIAHAIGGTE